MTKTVPKGSCSLEGCPVAGTGHCHELHQLPSECPNWKSLSGAKEVAAVSKPSGAAAPKKPSTKSASNSFQVGWSGEALRLSTLGLVSHRSTPLMIATVGEASAGKTSFLGMLHTLLLNGRKLQHYAFAGSLTLLGWEELAHYLRIRKGQTTDTPSTTDDPNYYSILHWALRHTDQRLVDVLFPDAGGEVFSRWAIDAQDSAAENVRWIQHHADAFIFFVNCKALAEQRGEAVTNLQALATRLKRDRADRPVIVVWSKADYLDQVRTAVRERVEQLLVNSFGDCRRFEISYELTKEPDHRQLAMLGAVDEVLNQIASRRWLALRPAYPDPDTKDVFLLYQQ